MQTAKSSSVGFRTFVILRPLNHRRQFFHSVQVTGVTTPKSLACCRWKQATVSCARTYNSKVPQRPTWQSVREDQIPPPTRVPPDLVDKLERLALLDFRNQDGVDCLEKAIRFADQLHVVDTEGVEPMDTVLEHRTLFLRPDQVEEGDCTETLLALAKHTVEDYYRAPPGNIPLPEREERGALLKNSVLTAQINPVE